MPPLGSGVVGFIQSDVMDRCVMDPTGSPHLGARLHTPCVLSGQKPILKAPPLTSRHHRQVELLVFPTQPHSSLPGAHPRDPLEGMRREDAAAEHTLRWLGGDEVRKALAKSSPNLSQLGWREAVDRLREGVTATYQCTTTTKSGAPASEHRLFFAPDGTVRLLDHPVNTTDGALHTALGVEGRHVFSSTDYDLSTMVPLHVLGAPIPGCVRAALWLTGTQDDPTGLGATLGETLNLTSDFTAKYRSRHLPVLYAAVAWAQHSFWPRGAGQRLLEPGVTPRLLRAWADAGWTVNDALQWLRNGATLTVANMWGEAGDTSVRAARLAGLGQLPVISEQPWLDAGFAPGESDPWHARKEFGQIPQLSPVEAYEWHRHRVRPNSVRDFKNLPASEADAVEVSLKRRGLRSARLPDGTYRPMLVPTLQRALEWTTAGVPSEMVLSWCNTLGVDDTALQTAFEWSRIIPAPEYATITDWNTLHPDTPLTPADVARLRRIGMATDGTNMGRLITSGLSNNDILRPVQMLVAGKRWHGRSLRNHLTTAATTSSGSGETGAWVKDSKTVQNILDGQWDRVIFTLKSIWASENRTTWRVVIDWHLTNPTPPPPYRSGIDQPSGPSTGATN